MPIKQLTTKGNVWKRTDGYWNGDIRYIDEKGNQRRKCFGARTKKEILIKLQGYKLQFQEEVDEAEGKTLTLKKSMKTWLETFKYTSVETTTYDRNEFTAKEYIYPILGDKYIVNITAADVHEILVRMMQKGYSHSTVKKVYSLMNQYFRYIYSEDLIPKNPMKNVRMIKKDIFLSAQGKDDLPTRDSITILTDDEIKLLRKEIYETREDGSLIHSQASAYLLMLNTGLRAGEMLGLINSDIDMENRLLHVNRTVKIVKNRSDKNVSEKYELITGKTKTKSSKRIVPLNYTSIEIIESLRKERYFGEDSPLIPNKNGEFTKPIDFRVRWYRLLERAGIEQKGLHSLRHTFATNLVNGRKDENGIVHTLPIRQVADILGHSTTAITEKYYVKRDITKLRGTTNKFKF